MLDIKTNFRIYCIIILLLLATTVTVIRYGILAFSGKPISQKQEQIVSIRGTIYDRNGRILAYDTDLYDVSIWKPSISKQDYEFLSFSLASTLNIDKEQILNELNDSKKRFAYIARRISNSDAERLRKQIAKDKLSGIKIDRVSSRLYPQGRLASHLIGYTGNDNQGLSGAESFFDRALSPNDKNIDRGYAFGNSVFLTIDSDLQYQLEEKCRKVVSDNNAEALAMVVIDAKQGDVLSYISLPDFEPSLYQEADTNSKIDRVSIYAYEPGSVFKVYSMSSLMALGAIDEKSTFTCNGKYEHVTNSGEEIVINCLGKHGTITVRDILKYSCNAAAAYASDTVSSLDFYSKIREFGFGSQVGADVQGESYGLIRKPDTWSARSKPTIAMGQEILTTAMQLASAGTAIANDGILMRVRTLEQIIDNSDQIIEKPEPEAVCRVLEIHEAETIRAAMESATLGSGTGRRAAINDIRMSVKTGTAQVIDKNTRRYSDTDYIASTIALFPSENPEYIIYAAVFNPKGSSIFGSVIAAPLVKDAANLIADLYSVTRSGSTPIVHSGRIAVNRNVSIEIGEEMPNLINISKRSLSLLLERTDINVEIEGEGWVYEQYPLPGEPIIPGTTIILKLK